MPLVPISTVDDPAGPQHTYYVPKAGGTFDFTVHIVATSGAVLDPVGVYAWSCRPLQSFMDITHRPTGHITGTGTAAADFIVFANAGPSANTGTVDLMATSPFIDGAIGGVADPFNVLVYQFGTDSWVPPYGFVPSGGWVPGDPPPSPWVDGDPAPDGWTPPTDYVPVEPCTYSIDPVADFFGQPGGTGTVVVSTSAGCDWSAAVNDSWLLIISFVPVTGPGSLGYQVAANPGPARVGTITIAGQTFTVTQAGRTYTQDPPPTGTFTPSAPPVCADTRTPPASVPFTPAGSPSCSLTTTASATGTNTITAPVDC